MPKSPPKRDQYLFSSFSSCRKWGKVMGMCRGGMSHMCHPRTSGCNHPEVFNFREERDVCVDPLRRHIWESGRVVLGRWWE